MLADGVWWLWVGMGLGHAWECCKAPPCCAGCGWEDVPGAGGGCSLVQVGVPGVHVDKLELQGQCNCPCSVLPRGKEGLIQAIKLGLERKRLLVSMTMNCGCISTSSTAGRGWCLGRACPLLHREGDVGSAALAAGGSGDPMPSGRSFFS